MARPPNIVYSWHPSGRSRNCSDKRLVLSAYCGVSPPDVAWEMTHEKQPEIESDEAGRPANSAMLRERVEALQEKVSALNEVLNDAQQTLRQASDYSGDCPGRD